MGKPETLSEFYSKCKDRFQDLTLLNGVIITDARDLEEVDVWVELRTETVHFSGRWDRRSKVYGLTEDDEILNLWETTRKPGCYKWLYLADLAVLDWAAHADPLEEGVDPWEVAAWYSTVVCSIGRMYEDMRPSLAYVQKTEEESLSRLRMKHELDHDSKFYQAFLEVLADIHEGTKPYIKDISSAITRSDLLRQTPFAYKDYHVSFKKTGTRLNGKSYPGLYSSMFETDSVKSIAYDFDQYTGYCSHYNGSPQPGQDQPGGRTITIEQHKLDRRTIHMGDNPRQDRMNYVHRRVQSFLNLLPEDCTKDQNRGVDFAKEVTDPGYRTRHGNNIYSLDISKATDTIDMEFQVMCLSALLPREIVSFWEACAIQTRVFDFTNHIREEYQQTCGQPQGYKSSFPCFAWCHHVLMRIVMKLNHLENLQARGFYRVLGDDSIISAVDKDESILNTYIEACQWINWSTNRSKGYVAHSYDTYAFAEFAKKRVLNGKVNTPIPSKLILNSERSGNGTIGLFQWISENYRPLSIVDIWRRSPKLTTLYDEDEISLISWMAGSGTIPALHGWLEDVNSDPRNYSEQELMIIIMSYFLCKFRSTLVDQILPDNLRDCISGGFDESNLSYFLNSHDEEELFSLIEDSDNKYLLIIQNNLDMIEYINHVLFSDRSKPTSEAWISLELELTTQEEDRIFNCLEICDRFSRGIFPTDVYGAFLSLTEGCKILTRFNPRGDARVSYQNGTLWTPLITKWKELMS